MPFPQRVTAGKWPNALLCHQPLAFPAASLLLHSLLILFCLFMSDVLRGICLQQGGNSSSEARLPRSWCLSGSWNSLSIAVIAFSYSKEGAVSCCIILLCRMYCAETGTHSARNYLPIIELEGSFLLSQDPFTSPNHKPLDSLFLQFNFDIFMYEIMCLKT